MPRDKTNTHNRLLLFIREEFLEHGYAKASLKNIAEKVELHRLVYIDISQIKKLCLLQWLNLQQVSS